MLVRTRTSALTLALVALAPACGDDDGTAPGVDASVRMDATTGTDAATGSDGAVGPDAQTGTDSGTPEDCDRAIPGLATVSVTETRLSSPLYVAQPPGSTDLYVVQRGGLIRIIRGDQVLPTAFFDASGLLDGMPTGGNEWGLLGLAFHPDYQANGRFFVYYTPRGSDTEWENIVAEGRRSAGNPDVAETSLMTLLTIDDFASNHNGGVLQFGPDGYLYVGTGDGGGQNDPRRTAQDLGNLLGKILRLDVSTPGTAGVPMDNPFRGMAGARGEIWSYGLRNPWRISFDRSTGDMWIGDVGQDAVEEINFTPGTTARGANFGWPAREGSVAGPGPALPPGTDRHEPIAEYSHDDGLSIVGGYVYRGSAIPELQGTYFYADSYADDYIRAMRVCDGEIAVGPERVEGLERPNLEGAALVSFGQDNAGELYVVYLGTGEVRRIVAAD